MLTWRAISRPAATLRQGPKFQSRFIHHLRFLHLQAPPRPNTLIAKIRFRADGKPRSKLIAAGFGSLILSALLLLFVLSQTGEFEKRSKILLVTLALIQKLDNTYDSVKFDDSISTLSYFKKLYQCFSWDSEEQIERTFNSLTEDFKTYGSKSTEDEAQHIMRSAADKVHVALRNIERESISEISDLVSETVMDAMNCLLELVVRDMDDKLAPIRNNTKDTEVSKNGEVSNDYEVLG